jgi:hypothetical protein
MFWIHDTPTSAEAVNERFKDDWDIIPDDG